MAQGNNSKSLFAAAKPSEFHMVDFWGAHPNKKKAERWLRLKSSVEQKFSTQIKEGIAFVHEGDFSDIVPGFPDRHFDWVYIDGLHQYQYVKRDIELMLPKMKPGAFMSGHDFTVDHDWGSGVVRAVLEFVQDTNSKFVAVTNEVYSSWVIQLPQPTLL